MVRCIAPYWDCGHFGDTLHLILVQVQVELLYLLRLNPELRSVPAVIVQAGGYVAEQMVAPSTKSLSSIVPRLKGACSRGCDEIGKHAGFRNLWP